jgi:hypothetical protein
MSGGYDRGIGFQPMFWKIHWLEVNATILAVIA